MTVSWNTLNPHMMLDIETLGTAPGCVVLSVGACLFNPVTGKIGSTYEAVLDIDHQTKAGLTIDPATEAWHKREAPEAYEAAMAAQARGHLTPPHFAMNRLRTMAGSTGGNNLVWCWGAAFDFPILDAMEAALNHVTKPLCHYRQQACARTVCQIANVTRHNRTEHTPLADCTQQVEALVRALAYLGPMPRRLKL
jgi:hypothetical protein